MPNPDSLVAQVMQAFKADLLARDANQMRAMTARWLDIERLLNGEMQMLAADMAARQAEGKAVSLDATYRMQRYQSLKAQVIEQTGAYQRNYALPLIRGEQATMAELGIQHAATAIRVSGIAGGFDVLDVSAVQNMVGLAGDGSPLFAVLRGRAIAPEAVQGLTDALVKGTALGWNPRQTARAMADGLAGGLDKALTIARTEQLRVYRQASVEEYRASGVVSGFRRMADKSGNTCIACLCLDGQHYDLEGEFSDHVNGRCLVPGTVVEGAPISAFIARHYQGDVVSIRTASGKFLTVTPNHPILTDHGWVAANLLREGDNVVSDGRDQGTAASVSPDEYQMPTVIEQIPSALCMDRFVTMPCAPEDFHGDGVGSQVYVVRANRFLGSRLDTALTQPIGQHRLSNRNTQPTGFSGAGDFAAMLKGLFPAASPILGDCDTAEMLFDRRLDSQQLVSFGLRPYLYAGANETLSDARTGCTKRLGQFVLGFASQIPVDEFGYGQASQECRSHGSLAVHQAYSIPGGFVAPETASLELIRQSLVRNVIAAGDDLRALASNVVFDRVLEVSGRAFSGHVYNLQTSAGWYSAGSIITHNCSVVPELTGEEGQPPQWQTGQEWLQTLDPAGQRQILGDERYAMWQDGKAQLSDFATMTHSDTWGDSPAIRPLSQLAA